MGREGIGVEGRNIVSRAKLSTNFGAMWKSNIVEAFCKICMYDGELNVIGKQCGDRAPNGHVSL